MRALDIMRASIEAANEDCDASIAVARAARDVLIENAIAEFGQHMALVAHVIEHGPIEPEVELKAPVVRAIVRPLELSDAVFRYPVGDFGMTPRLDAQNGDIS